MQVDITKLGVRSCLPQCNSVGKRKSACIVDLRNFHDEIYIFFYLVEEIDNTAIFPTDTGRFRTTQISPGMTYEVHGEVAAKGQQPHSDTSAQPNSPYGLYTAPVFASSQRPHSTPTNQSHFTRVPKKAIRKAISLVSLTSVDASRPSTSKSSKMEYGVITQVFLCLTPDQCNVRSVSDLMAEQVGFPVILLDSKCYPLSSNSGTSGTDFWKSTRRILAASKSLYEQLSGHDSGVEHAEVELTQPSNKKPRKDTCTLVEILDKVSAIKQKVSVPRELTKALQCSICQGIASPPVVSSCCQRVVACAGCNHTWSGISRTSK